MQFRKFEDLLKAIKKYPVDEGLIVVIYGKDVLLFNTVVDFVEKEVYKNVPVEISLFTGEQEDLKTFINDLYNFSLFIPHRLYILKQAHSVLKNLKNFVFKSIPEKTWILLEFEGDYPEKLFRIDSNRIFLYETKILYDNQIDEFIHSIARELHLQLSEEAIQYLKLFFPPRESVLRTAIYNIRNVLENQQGRKDTYFVTYEDIRTVFYRIGGWDMFKIIEAMFGRDLLTFLVEVEKYNPPEDNYSVLLKNLLIRVDELRKYLIGKKVNFTQKELLTLTKADKKPPFIQKKILQQLETYSHRYSLEKLEKIYKFLVDVAFAFRSNIEEEKKKIIFIEKSIETFFTD